MADGRQKGMHSDGHSLVIHAAPEFSLTHFRGDRDAAADILLQHAAEWIGSSKIVSRHVHGWLYSFPRSPQEFSSARIHLVQDVPPLYLAGDGLTGGRIEGAYLSGKDVARSLLA